MIWLSEQIYVLYSAHHQRIENSELCVSMWPIYPQSFGVKNRAESKNTSFHSNFAILWVTGSKEVFKNR